MRETFVVGLPVEVTVDTDTGEVTYAVHTAEAGDAVWESVEDAEDAPDDNAMAELVEVVEARHREMWERAEAAGWEQGMPWPQPAYAANPYPAPM